jgi:hypothetical protein
VNSAEASLELKIHGLRPKQQQKKLPVVINLLGRLLASFVRLTTLLPRAE